MLKEAHQIKTLLQNKQDEFDPTKRHQMTSNHVLHQRDVEERIALGEKMQNKEQIDQHVYQHQYQSNSNYQIYSKPLFQANTSNTLYKPTTSNESLKQLINNSTRKLKKDNGLYKNEESTNSNVSQPQQPVQFEKIQEKNDQKNQVYGLISQKKKKKTIKKGPGG